VPLACPYCQREIVLRNAPAPRFKAPCPGCGELFVVRVALRTTAEERKRSLAGQQTLRRQSPSSKAKQAELAAVVSSHVAELTGDDRESQTEGDVAPPRDDVESASLARETDTPGASDTVEESANSVSGSGDEQDWLDDWLESPDPEPGPADAASTAADAEEPTSWMEPDDSDEGEDLLEPTIDLPRRHATSPTARESDDVDATVDVLPPDDEPAAAAKSAEASAQPTPTDDTQEFAATDAGGQDRSAAPSPAPQSASPQGPLTSLPVMLGGYHVTRELGHGAMGAVYLAKQLSLNRDVAVKVIQERLSADPYYVARFTREAYAAAQLTHHNVVQVYDLGVAKRLRFFSMEFVRGSDLGRLLQTKSRLSAREAAGYILQAARGLKFAHDHGLVHRDIKPENLMLNEEGLVKVADLGLVKSVADAPWQDQPSTGNASGANAANANMTMAQAALGTPAYMPPEQAEHAAGVDHRGDIYSLGCTLYCLLTGRPPFSGKTIGEVITKHKTGHFTPPGVLVDSLPEELSSLTLKMMARRPEDRPAAMDAVIAELQQFLGQGVERFRPRQEHAKLLQSSLKAYREVPLVESHGKVWAGFYLACLLWLIVSGLIFGSDGIVAIASLALLAPAAYGMYAGQATSGCLYLKLREFVFAGGWRMGLKIGITLAALATALYLLGWLIPFLAGGALAVAAGVSIYHFLDRRIAQARREPLDAVAKLLRRLRQRGADEGDLQMFVAESAGDDWEEFYEDLYGYEAKLQMRKTLHPPGREAVAKKFRPWRDAVIRWLDSRSEAARAERDKRVLATVEREKLRAGGLSAAKARERAEQAAEALVGNAAALRKSHLPGARNAADRRRMIKGMLIAAQSEGRRRTWWQRQLDAAGRGFDRVLGSTMRGLVGIILLVGCIAWMNQNGLIPWRPLIPPEYGFNDVEEIRQVLPRIPAEHRPLYAEVYMRTKYNVITPLEAPGVPMKWTSIFYSYGAGAAGIVLMISSLMGGRWNVLFILPAVYVLLFGPLMGVSGVEIPALGHLSAEGVSYAIGGLLASIGFVVGARE